jgi:hypothetical protein
MIDEEHNSSVVNKHFKLKIKTLQNAPREARTSFESKEKGKG